MENSKKEKLLNHTTKLIGSEEEAKKLISEINDMVNGFSKEQFALVKNYVSDFRSKTTEAISKFDLKKEDQEELLGFIGGYIIDEMIFYLLINAAECSIFLKMKCSDFIFRAADIWETSAMQVAISSMKSNLMDMIMKVRPEPPKDHLS